MQNSKAIVMSFCILIFTNIVPHSTRTLIHPHYFICLSKSNYLLSVLDQHNYYYKPCDCLQEENCVRIDSTIFSHKEVMRCIQTMISSHSLKPLLALSRTTYSTYDDLFIRELYVLIFTVHKQIFLEKYKEKPQALKKIDLNTILEISERINQLPIAEVLNAIDMLINELPPFLEKYEFNSKISWKEWLKKYWWVPPIFGGWFALKVLLSLQRPHYYFSPYLSPRPTGSFQPIITNDPVLAEIIVDQRKNQK